MKTHSCLVLILSSLACAGTSWGQYPSQVVKDVVQLVEAAGQHQRAWEWSGECVPEVDEVAKHGKAIAPLLVELLDHRKAPNGKEWPVDTYIVYDQQIQLALCKIFKEKPELGATVYGARVLEVDNLKVKTHWQHRVQSVSTK